MANFVHLHLHTEYSLLDGVSKIKPLIAKVKAQGMNAVAITDHGVMYGAHEFWSECKKQEIKPIIGCEVYIAERSRHDKQSGIDNQRYHLTLLAKNKTGYFNLVKLVSLGFTEGFYYKPRIDRELLERYGEGLIALSGCLGSNFNRLLASKQDKEAVEWIKFLQGCVDDVYIELQRNGIDLSEKLIPVQVQIAKELGLDIVATCDTHYLEREDHKIQEIAWCISDGKRLDDPTHRQYGSTEFYLKSPDELTGLFKDLPEAVENTQKLADSVESYSIEFERVQPMYDPKLKPVQVKQTLHELAFAGAKERYGEITEEIDTRLNYELGLIDEKGYNDYFLVVQDYVNWAKSQGILVGPGRGSGTGSIVAYCLKITNICPLTYNLIFERFLNPERPSPPDFDIDFQDDRRDELFEYVQKRYGIEHTSYVGTFGKLKSKAAIRDVARVMGIDLQTADKLSKMVLMRVGRVHTIPMMMAEVPEFAQMVNSDPELLRLVKYVEKLEDVARHVSMHACGFLITPRPVVDYLPLQIEPKGGDKVLTQFEGGSLEYLGLMKFDFLGLKNLSIIANTVKQIKYSQGVEVDIDQLPLDDAKTYKLFQDSNTTAVFQFESEGMKRYLRDLQPNKLDDLIFMNAAYRPGAMAYIPDYIKRKNGKQAVTYPDESIVDILKPTYGFAIYQEQVLNIAVAFAGYSLGEADMLRRAMGKKKVEVMAKEKEKFIQKAIALGRKQEKAEEIFSYLAPFADYGFNRSHSAAYALVAYQTAYLKANYPLEFVAGLMQTDIDNVEKLKRDLAEAQHMGLQVLQPDINKSFYSFSIAGDNQIRFGLGGIKGSGARVMKAIVDERAEHGEFLHLDNLISRVGTDQLSKKDLECLIKVGALDEFGDRNSLLTVMPGVFDRLAKTQSITSAGQLDLFGSNSPTSKGDTTATPLPALATTTETQKIQWEVELLGVFLSSHPLDKYFWATALPGFVSLAALPKLREGTKVKVLAIVDTKKVIRTKTDNKPMSFLTLSDLTSSVEAVMFNRTHEQYAGAVMENQPYVIEGAVSFRNDACAILIDSVQPAETLTPPTQITLNITNISIEDELARIKGCLDVEGQVKVTIIYGDSNKPKRLERNMHLTPECLGGVSKYIVK